MLLYTGSQFGRACMVLPREGDLRMYMHGVACIKRNKSVFAWCCVQEAHEGVHAWCYVHEAQLGCACMVLHAGSAL